MAKKNIYDGSTLILKSRDVPAHTKHLQGINLPIKVNSLLEDGSRELANGTMRVTNVDGVDTLVITPEPLWKY